MCHGGGSLYRDEWSFRKLITGAKRPGTLSRPLPPSSSTPYDPRILASRLQIKLTLGIMNTIRTSGVSFVCDPDYLVKYKQFICKQNIA